MAGFFFKKAVGAKRRHQVHNEAMQRAVARMFYLANIFQLIFLLLFQE
jgi:hypothetical protein